MQTHVTRYSDNNSTSHDTVSHTCCCSASFSMKPHWHWNYHQICRMLYNSTMNWHNAMLYVASASNTSQPRKGAIRLTIIQNWNSNEFKWMTHKEFNHIYTKHSVKQMTLSTTHYWFAIWEIWFNLKWKHNMTQLMIMSYILQHNQVWAQAGSSPFKCLHRLYT